MNIKSDDALVEGKLRELFYLCLENGAYFHSEISIIAEQGALRIESKLERSSNEPIIYLPEACLPRIEDFDIKLAGERLSSRPRQGGVSELHAALMGGLLELYSHTAKIKVHKETFPLLVFYRHKDILRHLLSGRSVADRCHELIKQADLDALTVESFIGARFINYPYQDGCGEKPALMPIIDCLNHHRLASSYLVGSYAPAVEKGLMVRNSKPVENSTECFVRYTKADALSAYMSYGFVDRSSDFLRSIPMIIDLPNIGIIRVHSYTYTKDVDQVPPGAEDIRFFFPLIRRTGARELQVSYLMIPPAGAPMALRRILGMLISILAPQINKRELKSRVRSSESQILEQNRRYYKKLRNLLVSREIEGVSTENISTLNQLACCQLEKLTAYKNRRL